jgi:hypothetical protein
MYRHDQQIFCPSSTTAAEMLYVPPMNIRPLARRAFKSAPIVLLAVLGALVLSAGAAGAATNEIEGVWSFKGGSVAIQPLPNGTFQGTVVTPTTFAECTHTAGEVMWTGMNQQPDGSFWGFHQWFHAGCVVDTQFVGPTAWRVLHNSTGAHFLKVCFSHPGTSQPKIAPSGSDTEATFGCDESALIEPLPPVSIIVIQTVGRANAKACVSQTSLKIKFKDPKNDPLKEVVLKIASKKVADIKGTKAVKKALKKGITLKKLPRGTFKISVTATTILNQRLTGSQTYKSCTKGSGNVGLHKPKKPKKPKHHH